MFGKLFMGARAVFCMAGWAKGTVAKEGVLQYCVLAVLRHRAEGETIILLERRVLEGNQTARRFQEWFLKRAIFVCFSMSGLMSLCAGTHCAKESSTG